MIFKLEIGGVDYLGIDFSPCHREVQDLKDRPIILHTGVICADCLVGYIHLTVRRHALRLRLPGVRLPKIDAPVVVKTREWGMGQ